MEEYIWLAGLLEGEGCFTYSGKYSAVIVKMNDEDVIEHASQIMGGTRHQEKRGDTVMYIAVLSRAREVFALCKKILPYMEKRRTARMQEVMQKCIVVGEDEANREQRQLLVKAIWDTGKFKNKNVLAKTLGLSTTNVYNWTSI